MDVKTNRLIAVFKAVPMCIFYVLWLLVACVFCVFVFLFVTLFPTRSAHHAPKYGADAPGRIGVIAGDIVAVLLAYCTADMLRCAIWVRTSWPEHVEDYGSTIWVHVRMMAILPIVWPLILHWLGWYRQRWRSWRWKFVGTVAASILLGLSMAAFSLLVDRQIYPRMQIAFVIVALPVITAIVRGITNGFARWLGLRPVRPVAPDAW